MSSARTHDGSVDLYTIYMWHLILLAAILVAARTAVGELVVPALCRPIVDPYNSCPWVTYPVYNVTAADLEALHVIIGAVMQHKNTWCQWRAWQYYCGIALRKCIPDALLPPKTPCTINCRQTRLLCADDTTFTLPTEMDCLNMPQCEDLTWHRI